MNDAEHIFRQRSSHKTLTLLSKVSVHVYCMFVILISTCLRMRHIEVMYSFPSLPLHVFSLLHVTGVFPSSAFSSFLNGFLFSLMMMVSGVFLLLSEYAFAAYVSSLSCLLSSPIYRSDRDTPLLLMLVFVRWCSCCQSMLKSIFIFANIEG